jgi:Asp-tRNA(Asn)/Glu-tRNA(Gln) amidotransferase A subunit family amidase
MWPFHTELAAFSSGKDTPSEFLESCIACINGHEPEVGAFVHMNLDAAREAAARSTARWKEGKPLSKIDGMPVGIKDIAETIDMPTEMGSPLYKGWQSGRDAATVAALREAGAVIVGKTVTRNSQPPIPPARAIPGIRLARPAVRAAVRRQRWPQGCCRPRLARRSSVRS